jgi:hypothetical protein
MGEMGKMGEMREMGDLYVYLTYLKSAVNAETLTSQSFPLEPSALESSAFCYRLTLQVF